MFKLLLSNENEPVNIGNPEEISIIDLVDVIIRITKSKSDIVFKELPVNDPKIRQPDITKAKEKLNWDIKFSLEDGLKKTIDYFKNLEKGN